MKKICYIVGASGEDFYSFIKGPYDLLIACDGGYSALKKKGLCPDVLIGDLDSLDGDIPNDIEVIRHPVMKDDTDTMLCIKYGIEHGYESFVIFGGMGGRLSHTYANIQALAYLSERNMVGRLVSDKCMITLVKNGKISFDKNESGDISVFAYGKSAYGVCEKGLKYSIENATLTDDFPLGVSNSFTGQASEISVSDGTVLIIAEKHE